MTSSLIRSFQTQRGTGRYATGGLASSSLVEDSVSTVISCRLQPEKPENQIITIAGTK
jgi:hypothetical protein